MVERASSFVTVGLADGREQYPTGLPFDRFRDELRLELKAESTINLVCYTAIVDESGNVGSASPRVAVPHDQGGITEPIMLSVEENNVGTVLEWIQVPGAVHYNVVRGNLRNLRETGGFIDLGPVTCIEADSLDTNTLGHEDGDTPAPGEAFFYLVSFFDGKDSSYGTESVSKPREPGPGGCP